MLYRNKAHKKDGGTFTLGPFLGFFRLQSPGFSQKFLAITPENHPKSGKSPKDQENHPKDQENHPRIGKITQGSGKSLKHLVKIMYLLKNVLFSDSIFPIFSSENKHGVS